MIELYIQAQSSHESRLVASQLVMDGKSTCLVVLIRKCCSVFLIICRHCYVEVKTPVGIKVLFCCWLLSWKKLKGKDMDNQIAARK